MEKKDIREEATVPIPYEKEEDEEEKAKKKKAKQQKKQQLKGGLMDDLPEELSEEDQEKKQELELLVQRVQDADAGIQKVALDKLASEIKSATASMTSVPKPLKFLRPHYDVLKNFWNNMPAGDNKRALSDILAVMAMTMAEEGSRESLRFKMEGNSTDIGSWGHEFVRFLSGEIGNEYATRQEISQPVDDLMVLVDQIVPFDMRHNAEPEACDLLMEVERLSALVDLVDAKNYERVCLYLESCANYVPEPEDSQALNIALTIYRKMNRLPAALRIALRLNDMDVVKEIYSTCEDLTVKKQLAFILARQGVFTIEEDDETLSELINNSRLNDQFLTLARDLEVLEPKTPEDIFKTHLSETRSTLGTNVDSARQNLASTFVNGFVNCAFGTDKLMTDEESKWIYKNKEHGMISAAASLGMILLWDVDGGLTQIDKYLYSKEDYIKAGALLALGVVNSGVRNDYDPARALLAGYLEEPSPLMKIGAVFGLGIAYAGTAREDIKDLLKPVVEDSENNMEVVGIAALALGMVYVGTADGEVSETLLAVFLEREESFFKNTYFRYLSLGLGLLYLAKQEEADITLETLKTVSGPVGSYTTLTVETCAYAGTGNVLKIQKLLSICGEHPPEEEADEKTNNKEKEENKEKEFMHQGAAVLGISMVAMGEELGRQMAVRTFDHLLQYGELPVRRAVPLALGLLYVGDPKVGVMDTLSKLSHDADAEVAQAAIFALGMIGAGTNNSRAAKLLRNLSAYYYKDANHLFVVRLAQGLLHMGKGTLSINPYHSGGTLMHRVAMAGLLITLHSCLDFKNIILGKSHYMLFSLVSAIHPRMLQTFNEDLEPLPVTVRVGQAVDVVGQAGHPKTITGFQTHTTPVLIGHGERAELATDQYLPVSSILEGFVILKPNPDATEPVVTTKTK
ncbi:26S proteasome non-ATPase regulatory subunit 2 [Balamuthia mandrillaris]